MKNEHLQSLFHFDEDDLYANHRGVLSQKQRNRLMIIGRFNKLGQLLLGLLFIALAALCVFLLIFFYSSLQNRLWLIIWAPFLLIYTVITLAFARKFFRRFLKGINTTLEKVEGPCNMSIATTTLGTGSDSTRIVYHELIVGGERFRVPAKLALYVMQGDACAIYFVRGLDAPIAYQYIMSFELLSD